MFFGINDKYVDKNFLFTIDKEDNIGSFSYVLVTSHNNGKLKKFNLVRSDGLFMCISKKNLKESKKEGFFGEPIFMSEKELTNDIKLEFIYDNDFLSISNISDEGHFRLYVVDNMIIFTLPNSDYESNKVNVYNTLEQIKDNFCPVIEEKSSSIKTVLIEEEETMVENLYQNDQNDNSDGSDNDDKKLIRSIIKYKDNSEITTIYYNQGEKVYEHTLINDKLKITNVYDNNSLIYTKNENVDQISQEYFYHDETIFNDVILKNNRRKMKDILPKPVLKRSSNSLIPTNRITDDLTESEEEIEHFKEKPVKQRLDQKVERRNKLSKIRSD